MGYPHFRKPLNLSVAVFDCQTYQSVLLIFRKLDAHLIRIEIEHHETWGDPSSQNPRSAWISLTVVVCLVRCLPSIKNIRLSKRIPWGLLQSGFHWSGFCFEAWILPQRGVSRSDKISPCFGGGEACPDHRRADDDVDQPSMEPLGSNENSGGRRFVAGMERVVSWSTPRANYGFCACLFMIYWNV